VEVSKSQSNTDKEIISRLGVEKLTALGKKKKGGKEEKEGKKEGRKGERRERKGEKKKGKEEGKRKKVK